MPAVISQRSSENLFSPLSDDSFDDVSFISMGLTHIAFAEKQSMLCTPDYISKSQYCPPLENMITIFSIRKHIMNFPYNFSI